MRWTVRFIRRSFELLLLVLVVACASAHREAVKGSFPPVPSHKLSLRRLEKPVMRADLSTLSERGGKRFSLVLRGAPLGEVLRSLSRERGYNLVLGRGVPVDAPVTVELRDVTFSQALDVLSKSMGFAYVIDGNTLWVVKSQIDTEVFKLGVVNILRRMTVSSSISSGGSTGGEESTGGTLSTDVSVASSFNLWTDIGCNLCVLIGLSCKGGGPGGGVVELCSNGEKFVAINRSTGHVIVTAQKVELERVRRYLKSVASSLEKQVVMDVRIAEVELSRGLQLGVDWSKVFNNVFKSKYSVSFGQVSTPVGEMSPIPGFFSMGISARPEARDPFNLAVRALKKYGRVRVLSAPRIAVVNNQGAVIKVGEDLHFVTDVSSTTNTETNTIGCDVDTETYFVGVSLSLVPYVDEEGIVTLYVHPNVTELRDVRTFRSECGDVPVEEPEFSVREMDTVVKVKDGDTLVIGGLIKTSYKSQDYRTPVLGDIPGLGYLFSRKERERVRTELFIFITPHVIYNPQPVRSVGAVLSGGRVDVVGR